MASDRKLEVKAIISIDGEKVNYKSLKIHQVMGDHHDFELLLDHKTFDEKFFDSPEQKLTLAYSKVIIDLMHGEDEGNAYVFVGLVENVRMIAEDGLHGGVLLKGRSTTIELDRGEFMQSYSNTNLKLILEEITKGTLNMTKVIKPAWTHDIDFAIQYRESDWAFLRRICHQYNERYYFTGLDLQIGPHPEFPVVPLKYDLELRSLEVGSRLIPNQYTNYYYKRDEHITLKQDSPSSIDGATGWLQQVSSLSDKVNMSRKPNVPTPAYVQDMAGLIDATKRQKVANGAKMLYIRGECKTCDVRIGRLVQVDLPKSMGGTDIGLYRVYQVTHELDEVRRYRCTFEAIPADLEYLPTPEVAIPNVNPVECEVWDNEDPKGIGRIKVKFPFDPRPCASWISCMIPDAGGNGKGLGPVNRGYTFIPEVADSILIGFLDPQQLSQPFVMGSMYHAKNSEGRGGVKNNIKTIITRSKHMIQLDDTEGKEGITIIDKHKNLVYIDTAHNNITITANNNMTLNATETMTLNARNLNINVDQHMKENIGENRESLVGETYVLDANNKKEVIGQNSTINVGKSLKQTSGELKMITTEGDFIGKGAGVTLLQGRLDARISKG